MQATQVVEELSHLLSVEIDAALAYSGAAPLADPGPIQDELARHALEHQRHAVELHEAVLDQGHGPPEIVPDVKGYVIGALTAPRRRPTTEELLEAMRGNEQLTNSALSKARAKPLPAGVEALLRRLHDDEQRHLQWVERMLSLRPRTAAFAHP